MKKILAILLSVVMVFSLGLAAFATENEPTQESYKITIDNAVPGETYTAYKIFDVVYSGDAEAGEVPAAPDPDNRSFHEHYAYTIDSVDNAWWSVVTKDGVTDEDTGIITANGLVFTPSAADPNIYTVEQQYETVTEDGVETQVSKFDAAAFAALLAANTTGKDIAGTGTADGAAAYDSADELQRGTATITLTEAGYYFVTTSLGAVCALDTTEPEAVIREKNDVPDVTKDVSDKADEGWSKATDLDVGDTAYFKIEVTTGKGNNSAITLHDTMSAGLTLDKDSFVIKVDGEAVDAKNYTISYDVNHSEGEGEEESDETAPCTFDIVFTADFIKELGDNKTITITYNALLNGDAVIYSESNPNEAYIDYSNQSSTKKHVDVYTYDFDIVKVDSEAELLPGAEFTLTREGETEPIKFVKEGNTYRVATADEIANEEVETVTTLTSTDGKYHLQGLDAATYTLTETKAPDGYNILKDTKTIVIKGYDDETEDNRGGIFEGEDGARWATVTYKEGNEGEEKVLTDTVEIVNNTGTELPSTGGIGTTIFYALGALLVLGAVVLLISRRRMSAVEA